MLENDETMREMTHGEDVVQRLKQFTKSLEGIESIGELSSRYDGRDFPLNSKRDMEGDQNGN